MTDVLDSTLDTASDAATVPEATLEEIADVPDEVPVEAPAPVAESEETVADATEAATEPVVNADDTLLDAVSSTTDPVVDATEPVVQAAEPVLETVTETTEPIVQAAEPVLESVSSTTEPVVQAAQPVLETVTETTEPVLQAAEPALESVSSTTEPALETVTETTAPVIGSAPQLVGTVSSTTASTSAATETVTETVTPLNDGASPGSDVVDTSIDVPNVLLDQSAGTAEAAAAPILIPVDDSAAESLLPVLDQAEIVSIASAVGVVAVTRAVCSPSTSSIVFTNVRLIPCYTAASAQHVVASATSAAERVREKVRVEAPAGIADGFDRAVLGRREDDGHGLADPRLVVGMLLGFLYVAFLTLWLRATRLRWPRNVA